MYKLLGAVLALAAAAALSWAQPVTQPTPVGTAGAYNTVAPVCTNGNFCYLQVDVDGNLKTTGGGGGGGGAVTVADGADVTQGAIADAAATAGSTGTVSAKLRRLTSVVGAAGTAATGVVSVQGIASATPVIVGGAVASGATDSGNPVKVGAVFNTTRPTVTDGQRMDAQTSNRGELFVSQSTGSVVAAQLADNADAVAATSTQNSMKVIGRNYVFNGTTWDRMPGTTTGVTTTNPNIGTTADAVCATDTGTCSLIALTKRNNTLVSSAASFASQYPSTAVPYTATATGTTAATTATLAGAASVTTYICGFSIRANATAAATGNATVTGVITATMNFTQWTAPLASGLGITEMIFSPCVPASGTNTSIAVVSAAPGTGGVVSVSAWGYKL